jgi:hypothetical protein
MKFHYSDKIIKGAKKQSGYFFLTGILFLIASYFNTDPDLQVVLGVGFSQLILGAFQWFNSGYMRRRGFVEITDTQIIRNSFFTKRMEVQNIDHWKDFAGDITFVGKNDKELAISKDFMSVEALNSLYAHLEKSPFRKREILSY